MASTPSRTRVGGFSFSRRVRGRLRTQLEIKSIDSIEADLEPEVRNTRYGRPVIHPLAVTIGRSSRGDYQVPRYSMMTYTSQSPSGWLAGSVLPRSACCTQVALQLSLHTDSWSIVEHQGALPDFGQVGAGTPCSASITAWSQSMQFPVPFLLLTLLKANTRYVKLKSESQGLSFPHIRRSRPKESCIPCYAAFPDRVSSHRATSRP